MKYLCLLVALIGFLGFCRPGPATAWQTLEPGLSIAEYHNRSARGTVLVVHSVFQDRDTSLPMGEALWRAGFNSVSVKLEAGRPFHEYVAQLKRLVDRLQGAGPVYAVGHSMGADLVSTLASDDRRIEAVVALGFPVEIGLLDCPVALGAGAWDQVHAHSALVRAAGTSPLFISPTCDHSQESLDPYLQRHVAEFFGGGEYLWWVPSRPLFQGLFVLGLAGFLGIVLPGSGLRFVLPLLLLTVAACALREPLLDATLFACWLGLLLAPLSIPGAERTLAEFAGVSFAATGLSWMLNCYQSIVARPDVLLGLPVALLSWPPIVAARACNALLPAGPGPLFLVLVLVEAALPEKLVRLLQRAIPESGRKGSRQDKGPATDQ